MHWTRTQKMAINRALQPCLHPPGRRMFRVRISCRFDLFFCPQNRHLVPGGYLRSRLIRQPSRARHTLCSAPQGPALAVWLVPSRHPSVSRVVVHLSISPTPIWHHDEGTHPHPARTPSAPRRAVYPSAPARRDLCAECRCRGPARVPVPVPSTVRER